MALTVKELIERLQEMPQDKVVLICAEIGQRIDYVSDGGDSVIIHGDYS